MKIETLPIVSIAKEECTKMNVEQLASTLANSAVAIALAVTERPGQPYPLRNPNSPVNLIGRKHAAKGEMKRIHEIP